LRAWWCSLSTSAIIAVRGSPPSGPPAAESALPLPPLLLVEVLSLSLLLLLSAA
jgi:hypothetical protein